MSKKSKPAKPARKVKGARVKPDSVLKRLAESEMGPQVFTASQLRAAVAGWLCGYRAACQHIVPLNPKRKASKKEVPSG